MKHQRTWSLWAGAALGTAAVIGLAAITRDKETQAGGDSRVRMRRDRPPVSALGAPARELGEIRRRLESARPLASGAVCNEDVIGLLRRLAEHDPAEAIMFAAENPGLHGQVDLAAELLGVWLEENELAARDWLGGLAAGELRQQLVPVLVAHLASDHPEEALALAGELPGYDGPLDSLSSFGNWDHGDVIEGRVREQAYAGIFGEWAGGDPQAAAARADALEDPLLRNLAIQAVAAKWSRKDPNAAVEWMKHFPEGADRNSALQGLMPEWTASNPQAASSFLATLDDMPGRSEWLRLLGENWSSSDPAAALAWAHSLGDGSGRNEFVQTVLARVAESDVRRAAEFALTLPAGDARARGMETVLARWRADDAEAVNTWVEALPQESLREEARAVLTVK